MEVSRSGYYKYLKRVHVNRIDPDFEIVARVRQIHSKTRGSYGSRRMSGQLRDDGYDVGRYRARSLMKKAGVSVKCRKKFKRTTDSNHKLPIAPNLLDRQFEVERPNMIWCADITYLWTLQGWLYLAVVIRPVLTQNRGLGYEQSLEGSPGQRGPNNGLLAQKA
jgi:transposase InsO family protein